MSNSTSIIAILGDVHGHLTLAYRLLKRWEQVAGRQIDLILQVGDLGAYPPPFRLDAATEKFAKKDPEELGFGNCYYNGSPEADEILGEDAPVQSRISADLFFNKGNHEDFYFLEEISGSGTTAPVPVDHYNRIFFLRNGLTVTLDAGELQFKVAAFGGVRLQSYIGPGSGNSKKELNALLAADNIDILLSHDSPYDTIIPNAGSVEITELIDIRQPVYHFCGHYHKPGCQLQVPGTTRSYQMNEVNFLTREQLRPGCIGILEWQDREQHSFSFIDKSWLAEYNRDNYKEL